MAVTHIDSIRNAMADVVVDSIDVGGAGSLVLRTSGSAEVATLPCSNPAFGPASGGTATASAITDDTDATGGTTDRFDFVNGSAAAAGFQGSVGTSGEDINLSSVVIGAGDTVSITSLTYTAPA